MRWLQVGGGKTYRLVLLAAFLAGSALEDGVQSVPPVVDWPEGQAVGDWSDREVHFG